MSLRRTCNCMPVEFFLAISKFNIAATLYLQCKGGGGEVAAPSPWIHPYVRLN